MLTSRTFQSNAPITLHNVGRSRLSKIIEACSALSDADLDDIGALDNSVAIVFEKIHCHNLESLTFQDSDINILCGMVERIVRICEMYWGFKKDVPELVRSCRTSWMLGVGLGANVLNTRLVADGSGSMLQRGSESIPTFLVSRGKWPPELLQTRACGAHVFATSSQLCFQTGSCKEPTA